MTNTADIAFDHNGWPTSTAGRTRLREEIRTSWDGDDPWGSGLMMLMGLGDVLDGKDADSYPGEYLQELYDDKVVTYGDVQYWHNVINRYTDQVPQEMRY